MFTILYLFLLFLAGALFVSGFRHRKRGRMALGVLFLLMVSAFFEFLHFWAEKLWFDALGYTERFWILEMAQWGFAFAGFLLGALFVWLLLLGIAKERKWVRNLAALFAGLLSALWGYGNWSVMLLFFNAVPTTVTDPIFGMETTFYFFGLPFYKAVLNLLLLMSMIAIGAAVLSIFVDPNLWKKLRNPIRWQGGLQWRRDSPAQDLDPKVYYPLFTAVGVLLLLLAANKYFDRYELLLSGSGVVYGPGWTDVHVRIPMIWLVLAVCALSGIVLLIPSLRNSIRRALGRRYRWLGSQPVALLAFTGAFLAVVWFVALGIIPALFQNFKVNPNEITLEQPYIVNNIQFTRDGFQLNKIQEREYPVLDEFNAETVRQNQAMFDNIRLWDYRALDEVYKQFQEFRLYYEFEDIDIDRYRYNGRYNQVMVSAREMDVNNLPVQSQTFVNRKFKYTHGFGIVMNDVSEFTASGLPELLIKNIPPVSKYPALNVEEPRIYYGEDSREYVIVNSAEEEFDYPRGDDNVYIQYQGEGGVQLKNYWRQFLYAYTFNETKLLFSGYPRDESRIMFHRSIQERVNRLAPFLHYDDDPYIVLADGRLYWMIDAYTVSQNYPYSQPFSSVENILQQQQQINYRLQDEVGLPLHGVNYIRNSVKVVVDAYEGDVDFYVFEEDDPLIQAWEGVVPGLLKPWQEMPKPLLEHIRYPADLLLIQGMVYAKYHMKDPTVFYNQEDLWVRATEKYFDRTQPVEPYYILWTLPETNELSFVLMMPFTPKNRQVLVGWLAGLCDPEHYGELLAYNFPKDKRVIGPQQVETKIDQDPNLSSQLSLWDQRGSRVIRGNVLAIPVNETLFYVEPIYLQAETAAYPELRLVVIMQGDNMVYAPNFEDALEKILRKKSGEGLLAREEKADTTAARRPPMTVSRDINRRIEAANEAFENYLRYTSEKDFQKAARALEQLRSNLEALQNSELAVNDTL